MDGLRWPLSHVNLTLESLGNCINRDVKSRQIYCARGAFMDPERLRA